MRDGGFWYLGTPYSKYPQGISAAYRLAAKYAGKLIREGIRVYSPIAHTHSIAIHAGIDPYSHAIWMPADQPFMEVARGLIVLEAESWEQSKGIAMEIEAFSRMGKPVVYWKPDEEIPVELYDAPEEIAA